MEGPTLELEFCEVAGSPWEGSVRVRFGGESSAAFPVREHLSRKERDELRWYLEDYMQFPEGGNVPRAEAVQARLAAHGGELWEQLAGADGARKLDQWLGAVQASGGGRLELRAATPADELAFRAPWELMRTGGEQGTLLQSLGVTVVRRSNANLPRLSTPDTSKGLRVLAIVCRPTGTDFLDPRYTPQAILDALQTRPEVSLEFCRPPTLAALTETLRVAQEEGRPYHVVHFDGHGTTVAEEGGVGALYFEKEDGELDLVRAGRLGDLLASYHVPLVVLEACSASKQVFAQETVAGALLRKGIGSVLAMGFAVHVDMTRELMAAFYAAVARGQALGTAVLAGRERLYSNPDRRLDTGPDPETIALHDWFVPQLYQGDEDPVLLGAALSRTEDDPAASEPVWAGFLGEPRAGFQGRGHELHRLERAIEKHRAVVLHAPGGMGKTALAREAAHWWLRTGLFPDGAVFVSFETAASPEAVVQQVGQALEGEDFLRREDSDKWVEGQLRTRRLLIVWDNYESVLHASAGCEVTAPELAELARRWTKGGSRLLVTCRDDETGLDAWPCALEGLSEPEALFLLVRMLERLGTNRDERRKRGWTREALKPIHERTGGHPLALELLAPLIPKLGPAQVAEEMRELLGTASQVHLEARNRSMAASLDFSIRHLSAEARAALPSVALLSGGCLESMVADVVGLEAKAWAHLRAELERTGLLRARGPVLLPHPILADAPGLAPNAEQVERFIAVGRQVCESFSRDVRSRRSRTAVPALLAGEAAIRRALELAVRTGLQGSAWQIASSLKLALEVSGRSGDGGKLMLALQKKAETGGATLSQFEAGLCREAALASALRGAAKDAVRTLTALIESLETVEEWDTREEQALSLTVLGRLLATNLYRPSDALPSLRRAESIFRLIEREKGRDTTNRSVALGELANALVGMSLFAEALQVADAGLELDLLRDDRIAVCRAHCRKAHILIESGRFGEAEAACNQGLELARAAGDFEAEALALQYLGRLEFQRSNLAEAETLFRQSLSASKAAKDTAGEARIYNALGALEGRRRNSEAAMSWFNKGLELAVALDDPEGEFTSRGHIAQTIAATSERAEDPSQRRRGMLQAVSLQRDVLTLARRIGLPKAIGQAQSNLAAFLIQVGNLDEAEKAAEEALKALVSTKSPYQFLTLGILEDIATARGDEAAASDYRRRKAAALADAEERAGAPSLPAELVSALLKDALLAHAHSVPLADQLRTKGADDNFLPALTKSHPWLAAHLEALAHPGATRPSSVVPAPFADLLDQAWEAAGSRPNPMTRSAGSTGPVEPSESEESPAPPQDPAPTPHPKRLDENVQFTVYRPKAVAPERWYPVLAFAHLADARPEAPPTEPTPVERVREQAKHVLGAQLDAFAHSTQDSRAAVPSTGELTFVLDVPGLEVNPIQRSFRWLEDVQREEFRVRAPRSLEGTVARGLLSVYLGQVLIADLSFALRVDSAAESEPELEDSSAQPYRRIFASYSHEDAELVREFRDYAVVLGDEFVRDWTHLRSGEHWDERLLAMIEEADVFQLFWSSHAMRSEYVRREYEHALALGRPHFVRPTYWEDPLPEDDERGLPPAELRALHFSRLPVRDDGATEPPPAPRLRDDAPRGPDAPPPQSAAPSARSSPASPALVAVLVALVAAIVVWLLTR